MATDSPSLQVDLEEQEAWRRRLTVTIPAASVQTERKLILQKLGGRLKLPGFRKGKIPANVVEQRFGPAVDQELLDKVIGDAYRKALETQSLAPDLRRPSGGCELQARGRSHLLHLLRCTAPHRARAAGGVHGPTPQGRGGPGGCGPGHSAPPGSGRGMETDRGRCAGRRKPGARWTSSDWKTGNLSGESRPYEIVLGDGEANPRGRGRRSDIGAGRDRRFHRHLPG